MPEPKPLKVLIVEDSEDDTLLLLRKLTEGGYAPDYLRVETAAELKDALESRGWDVVLSDFTMPQFSGPAAFAVLKESGLDIPFILVSGTIGEDMAVEAMKSGVSDYMLKDSLKRLVSAVEREMRDADERRRLMATEKERNKLEEQLRQSQKMEALGLLAGGIAHEFNNRLAAMSNFCYLAQRAYSEGKPISDYLGQIQNSIEAASNLTKSLLAFSRKEVVRRKPIGVNQIIESVHKLLFRLIGEDIELVVKAAPADLTIMADRSQVENALLNLATNAKDAMPKGGKLSITAEAVALDEDFVKAHGFGTPGPYALISVIDTGVGMDDNTRQHIFEPFFTTKEVGKGTGLGLPIVYSIVSQHGGYINVYSEPGKGTAFRIYLPLTEEPAITERWASAGLARGNGETVLLAEDDLALREGTAILLEEAGYKVITAENGDEAVKKFEGAFDGIDVVVLDVVMPKMNGREAFEAMRRLKPGVKAIFLTGYSAGHFDKDLLAEGVRHMSKPVLPAEFLKEIREIVSDKGDGRP